MFCFFVLILMIFFILKHGRLSVQVHGSTRKLKPGWVAMKPGDRLTVLIDSSFQHRPAVSSGPAAAAARPVAKVSMLMLHSYEHMGRAMLSCVAGCTCPAVEVDFHESDKRVSQMKSHNLHVSVTALS